MCFGGGSRGPQYQSTATPVTLPPAPQIAPQINQMIQSTPARARMIDQVGYKKKGKRALTIPQTGTNVPGM